MMAAALSCRSLRAGQADPTVIRESAARVRGRTGADAEHRVERAKLHGRRQQRHEADQTKPALLAVKEENGAQKREAEYHSNDAIGRSDIRIQLHSPFTRGCDFSLPR